MNNRELLELAALAAGYKYAWAQRLIATIHGAQSYPAMVVDGYDWNPLEDDGDCARLETRLEMIVAIYGDDVCVSAFNDGLGVANKELYKDHGDDKNRARRFASVSVAAEIGRRMKERK